MRPVREMAVAVGAPAHGVDIEHGMYGYPEQFIASDELEMTFELEAVQPSGRS